MNCRQTPFPDIASEVDIRVIVEEFYDRAQRDPLLAPFFDTPESDKKEFVSVMCNFWNTMLLRSGNYHGKPYRKHESLGLKRVHFKQWSALFFDTIDTHFSGKKADELKQWVDHIGKVFQGRLANAHLLG